MTSMRMRSVLEAHIRWFLLAHESAYPETSCGPLLPPKPASGIKELAPWHHDMLHLEVRLLAEGEGEVPLGHPLIFGENQNST